MLSGNTANAHIMHILIILSSLNGKLVSVYLCILLYFYTHFKIGYVAGMPVNKPVIVCIDILECGWAVVPNP